MPLDEYRDRRDFTTTPEPGGGTPAAGAEPRFVIQEHHATALHWDLRLEHDGVLASWALPKGIPPDPRQNRLAVRTEDHPLEYLEFSGEIPRGQYGGGHMGIWDTGTFEEEKFRADEVIVVLHGERVSGRYVLFQTGGKNWMIHRMDPPQDPGRELLPEGITPMLAKPSSLPRNTDDWAFEIKWDGVRALATVQGGRVRLQGRSGLDMTATYPELRGLGASLGMVECVLDGEIVAFDDDGRPSFERLQQRINVTGDAAHRAAGEDGAGDLPGVRPAVPRGPQHDLAALRGAALAARGASSSRGRPGRRPPRTSARGARCSSSRASASIEGVIGKRLDSTYEAGRRTGAWIKVKNTQRVRLVIGGYTLGKDGRSGHIGAVVLGERHRRRHPALRGQGRLGPHERADRQARGAAVERDTSPFDSGTIPAGTTFVEPVHGADIEFTEWTASRTLRHPTFKALVRAGED